MSERHEAVMSQLMSGDMKNQNIPGNYNLDQTLANNSTGSHYLKITLFEYQTSLVFKWSISIWLSSGPFNYWICKSVKNINIFIFSKCDKIES